MRTVNGKVIEGVILSLFVSPLINIYFSIVLCFVRSRQCSTLDASTLPLAMEISALRMDNPVLQGFAFYASILVIKTVAMSFLTARVRVQKQVL